MYQRAFGRYLRQGEATEYPCTGTCDAKPAEGDGPLRLVDVPVVLEKGQIYLQLRFVPQGSIELVLFVPPDAPASALTGQVLRPAAVAGLGDPSAGADNVVADLIAGRYQAITARYSPLAAAGISPTADELRRRWQTITGPLGRLMPVGPATSTGSGLDGFFFAADLAFARTHVRVLVDIDNRLRVGLVEVTPAPPNGGSVPAEGSRP
jgi:hypothetical protein